VVFDQIEQTADSFKVHGTVKKPGWLSLLAEHGKSFFAVWRNELVRNPGFCQSSLLLTERLAPIRFESRHSVPPRRNRQIWHNRFRLFRVNCATLRIGKRQLCGGLPLWRLDSRVGKSCNSACGVAHGGLKPTLLVMRKVG
jgi:hypothetical protein